MPIKKNLVTGQQRSLLKIDNAVSLNPVSLQKADRVLKSRQGYKLLLSLLDNEKTRYPSGISKPTLLISIPSLYKYA